MHRCTHPIESINHQHSALFILCLIRRENLAWKTLTTLIHRRHTIAICVATLLLHTNRSRFHLATIIETTSIYSGINDIVVGRSRRLQLITHSTPTKHHIGRVLAHKHRTKTLNRKRLHGIWFAILARQITQNTLIYGSANQEFESGVITIAHIRKILMRQQLQKHCRNGWHTSLIIRAIPHSSTCPIWLIRLANITHNLRHHKVGQLARKVTVGSTLKATLIVVGIEYSECTDYILICANSCIGVKSQSQIQRNRLTLLFWQTLRATHNSIDPMRTTHIILFIVVQIIFRSIYITLETRPLQPITSTLTPAGIFTHHWLVVDIGLLHRLWHYTRHIAPTTTNLYCIGRNLLIGCQRNITQRNKQTLIALIKFKMAQIYPHSATHSLIYRELTLSACVVYRIGCIVGTLRAETLISDIHRILSLLWNSCSPLGTALFAACNAIDLTSSTIFEWILPRKICFASVSKSNTRLLPLLCTRHLDITAVINTFVVVNNYLVALCIALTRQQHISSRILQHRNQIWQDIALGI